VTTVVLQKFNAVDCLLVALEEDPVAPRWNSLLTRAVVAVSASIELVRRQKRYLPFTELVKHCLASESILQFFSKTLLLPSLVYGVGISEAD